MSYLALYRRYRPTTFENLVGQEHIVKTLVNQIEGDKIGHAYLFTGTRGTGKTSVAKIFAKAINCLEPVNGSPCGKCAVCKALEDPSNIDVVEIDAASNNGVNEIRDLREKVQYPPVSSKYKVYIVDEVHMLTGPAFNALLKTLEEPPKHAVFILATTEVHKIPATILSRCMRFDFKLISTELIADLISKIYDEQGKDYEKEAVFAIAKAGEGSIRDALSIADIAISYGSGKLTYNDVMEILGSSNSDILIQLVESIVTSKTGDALTTIDNLAGLGKSIGVLIKDVTSIVRDLLVIKTCDNANDILALPTKKFDTYKKILFDVPEQRLLRVLEIFSNAENLLKYTNHPRIIFETATIKASKPDADYNIDALISRISALENKLNEIEKKGFIKNKEVLIETVSKIEDAKIEPKKETETRISIQTVPINDVKGKLLYNLRQSGSEMLWNLLQTVEYSINGNILILTTKNSNDQELLDKMVTRAKIEEALSEFLPFELQINLSDKEKNLDAVDQATERLKKIFGDDIIVIK